MRSMLTAIALGVAKAILYTAVEESIHGKGFFVGGDDIIELEEGVERTRPQWLTQKQSDLVDEGWVKLSKVRQMTFKK